MTRPPPVDGLDGAPLADPLLRDAELIEAIRENPPDFVQQQEMFQTDGTFDKAKYLAFVASAATASEGASERYPAFQLPVLGLVSHRHREACSTARGKHSVKRLKLEHACASVGALDQSARFTPGL